MRRFEKTGLELRARRLSQSNKEALEQLREESDPSLVQLRLPEPRLRSSSSSPNSAESSPFSSKVLSAASSSPPEPPPLPRCEAAENRSTNSSASRVETLKSSAKNTLPRNVAREAAETHLQ